MNIRKFKVEKGEEGARLDLYLAQKNNDLSRSFIKSVIESNNIKVNSNLEFKANYKVAIDDEIEMSFIQDHSVELKAQDIPLEIIYEDDDVVVINKPPGMSVHPMNFKEEGTLVNALIYRYKNMKYLGDSRRTGLIHRLDKGTSGVILVGKTNTGLWHYSKQFADRNVQKYYLAISTGKVPNELKNKRHLTIDTYLKRNKKHRKKFLVSTDSGKFSKSVVHYLTTNNEYSLLLIKPYTGRTHQIRVHLASIGLPILGDNLYGGKKFERMLLHAWKLEIPSPKGKQLEFIADVPKEYKKLFPDINEKLRSYK